MRLTITLALLLTMVTPARAQQAIDVATAERLAGLALACVHREYPNKIAHVLNGDADVQPPRKLTPSFYGCFDWHSAVHGHWLLARLARLHPDAPYAAKARVALAKSLTAQNLEVETRYMNGTGRASFERPYGLAWLLQLASELRAWDSAEARAWSKSLQPLETAAAGRLKTWLPKLSYPVRSGEHSQSAFALGLSLDYARAAGDRELETLIVKRSREYFLKDRGCNLSFEPSGEDFVSPCLAEADLVRRVTSRDEFSAWLGAFLPVIPIESAELFLQPAVVTDPTDGKLAHLDGLNLSRAWMLDGIASALRGSDPRRASVIATRDAHSRSGLAAVTGEHYEGGHWLASFATYLTSRAGAAPPAQP